MGAHSQLAWVGWSNVSQVRGQVSCSRSTLSPGLILSRTPQLIQLGQLEQVNLGEKGFLLKETTAEVYARASNLKSLITRPTHQPLSYCYFHMDGIDTERAAHR